DGGRARGAFSFEADAGGGSWLSPFPQQNAGGGLRRPFAHRTISAGSPLEQPGRIMAMKRMLLPLIALLYVALLAAAQSSFTMEQVRSYPFPNELAAAANVARIAWAFNEEGRRNI